MELRGAFDLVGQLRDSPLVTKPDRTAARRDERVALELARVAVLLGEAIRDERRRRQLTLRDLATSAGLGLGTAQAAEVGKVCSLETYVRLADALRLKPEFRMVDPNRRQPTDSRSLDLVHAAMGEFEVAHLRARGLQVGLDEPFQHFQFAGRADVVAWSAESRAFLHIENKTRFPDIQGAFGSFNAKRSYLGAELAVRMGIGHWRSETHVIVALWSAEVLHSIRLHSASFRSVCPDPPFAFGGWWHEDPPTGGRYSILVVLDPARSRRNDRRQWLGMDSLADARPRYRDYANAVAVMGRG